MTRLAFSKYQAAGNDFAMVLDLADERPLTPETVARLCDRRTGVGADGLIRAVAGEDVFVMDYRNADGSPAQMCGNGARCMAALLRDRHVIEDSTVTLRTGGGDRRVETRPDGRITVWMGVPVFERSRIPMIGPADGDLVREPLTAAGHTFEATAVSLGNPHLVLEAPQDPSSIDLGAVADAVGALGWFPEGVNVEVVRRGTDGIDARVWERGSGETLACGSGGAAAAVATAPGDAHTDGVVIRFPGGPLHVDRRGDEVLLTGDAVHVFDGEVDVDD